MRTLLRGGLVIDTEPEVVVAGDRRTDRGRPDRRRRAGADRGCRGGGRRGDRRDASGSCCRGSWTPIGICGRRRCGGSRSTRISGCTSSGCSGRTARGSGRKMLLRATLRVRSSVWTPGSRRCRTSRTCSASDEHADAALDALERSGIRAVFGYGPSPLGGGAVDPAGMRRIMERASERIGLAVAAIGPSFVPIETVRADWGLADELGVPVVVHISSSDARARTRSPGCAMPACCGRTRCTCTATTCPTPSSS